MRTFAIASASLLLSIACSSSAGGGAGGAGAGSAGRAGKGAGSATGGRAASGGHGGSSGSESTGGRTMSGRGGSSGSESTGGRNVSGRGGNGGSSGMNAPPAKVNDCNGLGAEGEFQEITPPEVKAGIGMKRPDNQEQGGPFAIAVDPVNQGTLYVGTLFQKVWKSTDCGASWKAIATGTNADDVNRGMNWTFAIDPEDPQVIYTNSGYGSNGLFKSVDGGVNWIDIWSAKSQPELGKSFQYNFANVIAIDPSDHLHILLTFHEPCLPPHAATCIVESMDAGSSWRILDGEPSWNGNEGQVIFFLNDSKTWLWGSQTNGFWRSGDSGKSWERIPNMTTSHLQGSQLVRTKDGTFFVAGSDGIWRSADGNASTWTLVPDTGPIVGGLVSDGTTMFASTCYFGDFCNPRYLRSAETDGTSWTAIPSPVLSQGGTMGYDRAHKLLYSSNLKAGLWRIVVH